MVVRRLGHSARGLKAAARLASSSFGERVARRGMHGPPPPRITSRRRRTESRPARAWLLAAHGRSGSHRTAAATALRTGLLRLGASSWEPLPATAPSPSTTSRSMAANVDRRCSSGRHEGPGGSRRCAGGGDGRDVGGEAGARLVGSAPSTGRRFNERLVPSASSQHHGPGSTESVRTSRTSRTPGHRSGRRRRRGLSHETPLFGGVGESRMRGTAETETSIAMVDPD